MKKSRAAASANGRGISRAAASRPIQRVLAELIHVLHPATGAPERMHRVDGLFETMYVSESNPVFYYDPDSSEFLDQHKQVINNPVGHQFNENQAQITGPGKVDHFTSMRSTQAANTQPLEYTTDGYNRVTRARGTITLGGNETGRSDSAQQDSWKHLLQMYKKMFTQNKSFNGGHIIAHHMGGSPGTNNMVPMESNYNQSGSYKTFERALDTQLGLNGNMLNVDITVGYPGHANVAQVLTNISNDAGKITTIQNNAAARALVIREFRRIPNFIGLNRVSTVAPIPALVAHGIANPANPRLALASNFRHNMNVNNIALDTFGTEHPKEKQYGPNKGANVADDQDFERDYQTLYANLPTPGITNFLAPNNGLAGGVEAYIWMDPMGSMNKFGGSDTITTVDPLGIADYRPFRAAYAITQQGFFRSASVYKRGHLLNAKLHGPGADSRNLVPITTRANSDMSNNFEDPVKEHPALVDPRRGIFWRTESQGQVNRPGDWDLTAANAVGSGALFQQEADLPARIACEAWEGVVVNGVPKKGRKLLQYTVDNEIANGDGNLSYTRVPGAYDATHYARGANNAQTYTERVYNDTPMYTLGYTLQARPHAFASLNEQADYENGLRDKAREDGYQRRGVPGTMAGELVYTQAHAEATQDLNDAEGYLNINALQARTVNERADFDTGQERRGYDLTEQGLALPILPSAQMEGGRDRSHREHGRADGLALQVAGQPDVAYINAWNAAVDERGFNDGFALNHRASFWPRYTTGYNRGLRNIGINDGQALIVARDASNDYLDGHALGLENQGNADGTAGHNANAVWQNNQNYMRGYFQGRRAASPNFDQGFDAGYDNEMNLHPGNPEHTAGFQGGTFARQQGW